MPKAEGKIFKYEGEEVINKDLLETFPFKEENQVIEIVTNEFSAVCPFSGLPDIATVILQYIPFSVAIELKSLKYYFTSYRNAGVYQERATQLIHQHLIEALKTDVYVETRYNTRGGIDVICKQGGIKIARTGGK
jgi:7-cyano-7-deazaguanine reductase